MHPVEELIEPLIERHLTPGDPDDLVLPEGSEITVGFEFRVGLTEEQRVDYRARMEKMVKQRNELIHHLLDWLKLDTTEHCRSAAERLQRQRDEIEPLHRDIRSFLKVFLETHEQIPQMITALAADLEKQRKAPG